MSFDEEPSPETGTPSGSGPQISATITLQQAIDFGEYDPSYLATFAEWHTLSRHIQFQLIRKALAIRHRQLMTQWAELNNALDFSKKPHLRVPLKKIEESLRKLAQDQEHLYAEYT
jgi:hypothetical protein